MIRLEISFSCILGFWERLFQRRDRKETQSYAEKKILLCRSRLSFHQNSLRIFAFLCGLCVKSFPHLRSAAADAGDVAGVFFEGGHDSVIATEAGVLDALE